MTDLLKKLDAEDFTASVINAYQDKPITEVGFDRVRMLTSWSYLPNLVSLLSCGFFIYYLTVPFPIWSKVLLIILLVGVALTNEFTKRHLINATAKGWLKGRKVYILSVLALIIAIGVSMYSSYQGGNNLVLENSAPPTLPKDPQIGEISTKLQTLNESIEKQESTTWKGRITVDANRNLKALYASSNLLNEQLTGLLKEYSIKQNQSDAKHNTQITNFGYIVGGIGLMADLALFFMLFAIERIKYDVFRTETRGKGPNPPGFHLPYKESTPAFSQNLGSRAIVQGFSNPTIVKNVLNPDSSAELQALMTGHKTLAASYARRKTEESQRKAAMHKARTEELKKLKAVS